MAPVTKTVAPLLLQRFSIPGRQRNLAAVSFIEHRDYAGEEWSFMRQNFKLFTAFILIIVMTSATTAALTAPAEPQSRVETDKKTGALLFIVNGREEARINAMGLHVRHDVEYGSTITDTGEGDYIGADKKVPHAP